LGIGFYFLNNQTNSVKTLKEDMVLGLCFNPISSTSPCHNNITHMQLTKKYIMLMGSDNQVHTIMNQFLQHRFASTCHS